MEPTTGRIMLALAKSLLASKTGKKIIGALIGAVLLVLVMAFAVPAGLLMLVGGAGQNQQMTALSVGLDQQAATACDNTITAPTAGQVATGPTSTQQVANAKLIDAQVQRLGLSGKATLIALTTAVGESDLVNIGYGDAAGPDSRGLFQQRTTMGWGTQAQVMDPTYATESFLLGRGGNPGLMSVPNWSTGTITLVIHQVQRNADPNHYTKFIPRARMFAQQAGIDLNRPGSTTTPTTGKPSASPSAGDAGGVPLGVGGCGDQALLPGLPGVAGATGAADLSTTGPCPLGKSSTGVDCNAAIAYAVRQMNSGSRDWHRWCLRLVSVSYGSVYAGIPTAYEGCLLMQRRGLMHAPTKDYKSIPRGAVLWYDGNATGNWAGHVVISVGGGKAISNDVPVTDGRVAVVDISYFEDRWGQRFMGWSAPTR